MLRDHPRQTPIAVALLHEPALLTVTVTLELFWVLTSRAKIPVPDAVEMICQLMRLPTLEVADAKAVAWALDRAAAGADFADMLHLALSGTADSFITFDRDIARFAADAVVPVEILA